MEVEMTNKLINHAGIQAIQHAYSHAVKVDMVKKDLVKKTQEAAGFLSSLNKAEAKIKGLMNKANAAKAAQNKEAVAEAAKAEAKAAEVKATEAEAKLKEALETKEAEIKAADEKTNEGGQANMHDQYQSQVNLAYNKGYYLGWIAALKKI